MPLILNIDTALENGSVSLSANGELLALRKNEIPTGHATWIHIAIKEMMVETNRQMKELEAIAVCNGPGSYTGLRIGLSAAKGFCFALGIPLITIGTLEMMAFEFCNSTNNIIHPGEWLCPMIDARRMEAYFGIYDAQLSVVAPPQAAILQAGSFDRWLKEQKIIFFGNGSDKLKKILYQSNAMFYPYYHQGAVEMGSLSEKYYNEQKFTDFAYAEPLYIKEFYSPSERIG